MIKKKTHKNLYKQRLHVKKFFLKVFKFNQIIFIIQYRVQRCPDTEEPPLPTLVRLVKELILMLLIKIN